MTDLRKSDAQLDAEAQQPRSVSRHDGSILMVREVNGQIEEFEVPRWVLRELAHGHWWYQAFTQAMASRD
jgi:hypothetical protein